MKSINDSLFQKNILMSTDEVVGGSGPTTKHDPTFLRSPDGDGHYSCDHSADTCHD